MLRIRNLEAGYGKLKILKNLSMHVNQGEIVSIIGSNGAGKTTLLNTIAGIIHPFSGEIIFKDKIINNFRPDEIVNLGCVLVPEGRKIFTDLTVKENLIIGGYINYRKFGRKYIENELEKIYNLFPRLKERGNQLAGTLSGGEQQMLAIGRALMTNSDFIMLDEPSMGLAPLVVKEIFSIIIELKKLKKTILLVEQNARGALKISDRAYVLETGNLILEGTSFELINNHDVQRAYLGKEYKYINE